jgi:hypothetical protein
MIRRRYAALAVTRPTWSQHLFVTLQALVLLSGACLFQAARSGAATPDLKRSDTSAERGGSWAEKMVASRAELKSRLLAGPEARAAATRLWGQMEDEFPVEWDWVVQDFGLQFIDWYSSDSLTNIERRMISRVLDQLGPRGVGLRAEFEKVCGSGLPADDPRWWDLYHRACEQRRAERLETVLAKSPRIVFTKHPTVRPSFFAYTEGQSDAQNEAHFIPGATLCLLEMERLYGKVRVLLDDPKGALRDPAVSFDGQRILFAWKKSLQQDDYHLYEMDVVSGRVRQLTFGLGFADYEPAYLPNGDLIFSSTRCVQTVDCWWTEVSNLYTCDGNGRGLRRLGFDQVHAIFPTVTDDGRVLYTRWDYNDRGQIFPQPLFQMNPDGTGQTEFYGNNSWFPTTIAHARGIPGSQKVLAILCGHHTTQAGKLAVLDPARGRQENSGVQLVAPVRETRAERVDAYGQGGDLFQYPFPLSGTEFLVGYAPFGWENQERNPRRKGDAHFGIYWIDIDGHRELLASDPRFPCQQPVPLAARPQPTVRPSAVDYRKTTGTYYVQDVYAGPGLAGVPRGTVKKLRAVALEFRPAGVGNNGSGGPGGGALISTPIAIGHGSWDVKVVLGDATVHPDGSAFFTVPARTPLYFQALDEQGRAVQTMRSWSTLQPGENQSCVGCHEHKNTAPPASLHGPTLALRAGAQTLEPFYGPPRGFSFQKEIQPILDQHCISCHDDRGKRLKPERLASLQTRGSDPDRRPVFKRQNTRLTSALHSDSSTTNRAFSLLGVGNLDRLAKRTWTDAYLNLTQAQPADNDWDRGSFAGIFDGRVVNWIGSQSIPAPLPPYSAGAVRSELLALLEQGHGGARLSRQEMDKLACWIDLYVPYCGDYVEANAWTEAEMKKFQRYQEKRRRMEEIERRTLEELSAAE